MVWCETSWRASVFSSVSQGNNWNSHYNEASGIVPGHIFAFQWMLCVCVCSCVCVCVCVCVFCYSVVSESLWPQTVAHQDPLSMEFPEQNYWSEPPFPLLGHPSNPGTGPRVPASLCTGRQILYHWASWEAPENVAQASVYTGVTICITGDFSWGSN